MRYQFLGRVTLGYDNLAAVVYRPRRRRDGPDKRFIIHSVLEGGTKIRSSKSLEPQFMWAAKGFSKGLKH